MASKPMFDSHDYEQHHLPGAIGYFIFFVPLVINPKSRFCRFCANQGLLALIIYLAIALAFGVINMIVGWIPFIGGFFRIVGGLLQAGVVALSLYYAWRAYNGDALPFPYIGGIELIR